MKSNLIETFYTANRNDWRAWLSENYTSKEEIWLIFPMKAANQEGISYNDAVEEALCFGWIDTTIRNIDETHRAQRFCPRKKGSPYSRPNIERLIWLDKQGLICPSIKEKVANIIYVPYEFPSDIIEAIKEDAKVWNNYLKFPEAYKRIRIAYIDAARKRPLEFKRRLQSFINSTKKNRMVGYGGIDKYYID